MTLALAACGGGSDNVDPLDPLPGTNGGVPLPDLDSAPVPPDVLIAETTAASINGAIITGIVRLEVVGWNMQRVQLLPDTGYEPVYARFIVSEDGKAAYVDSIPEPYPMEPWTCESAPSIGPSMSRIRGSSWPCDRTPGTS